MKGPENFNSEEINKEAEEIINSLDLGNTEAGKDMEGEPKPGEQELKEKGIEESPAQKESIEKFLKKVEEYTAGGYKGENTTIKSYKLSDGRSVTIWKYSDEQRDELPDYQSFATMIVQKPLGEGGFEKVFYSLYADGRMEKHIDMDTQKERRDIFLNSVSSQEDVQQKVREGLDRIGEKLKAAQEERQAGLRGATEVDMREAEKIFELLEESKE